MREEVEVVVIGAGQAGMSVSYYMTQHGKKHYVLERGRVGETWRSKRWDSFCLDLPNSGILLPGFPYSGDQPDGFMLRDEIVAHLERYAFFFKVPILTGVNVESVERAVGGKGYLVKTRETTFEAKHVVVATGGFQVPRIPTISVALPTDIVQLTPDTYKSPKSVADGAVLVVGSGSSGGQISEELIESGRDVYMCTSSCGWTPRRYRGRDVVYWFVKMGEQTDLFDVQKNKTTSKSDSPTIGQRAGDDELLPESRSKFACTPMISGKDGGHDLNVRLLAKQGVVPLGRLKSVQGYDITLAPDLELNILRGEELTRKTLERIDKFIEENAINAPTVTPQEDSWKHPIVEPWMKKQVLAMNLKRANINTVVWATGYGVDYSWVHVPIFDEMGYPIHTRGVTNSPGLYFIGIPWLYKRNSAGLGGVGEDAEYIASVIMANGL